MFNIYRVSAHNKGIMQFFKGKVDAVYVFHITMQSTITKAYQ